MLDIIGPLNERPQKFYVFFELGNNAQIHEIFTLGNAVPDPHFCNLLGKIFFGGLKVFFQDLSGLHKTSFAFKVIC